MPQYPPSSFEALVGSFLKSYSAVKGIQHDAAEQKIRQRQADRADQMQRIQMDEAGYDEIAMPTIEAPPGQSFAQKVGRFLSGGPEQPGPIVMKTHQSQREREIQDAGAAHTADREDTQAYGLELEALRAKNDRERTAMNNRTQIQVAGMQKQPNAQDATKNDLAIKHQVINDAIDATSGRAQEAYDQLPADVKRKYRIGANDMNAGVERWRNSRAMLAREGIQSREDIAGKKGSNKELFRQRLLGSGTGAPAGDPVAEQRADWDAAAAAAKQQGKDPVQLLGPRP
jgi:hypothetical protein